VTDFQTDVTDTRMPIDYPDTLGEPSGRYARERLSSAGQKVLAPGDRWTAPPPQFPSQAPSLDEISQREVDVAGIIPRIEKIVPVPDMPPFAGQTPEEYLRSIEKAGETGKQIIPRNFPFIGKPSKYFMPEYLASTGPEPDVPSSVWYTGPTPEVERIRAAEIASEGRGMVDEFGQIQAEQDALDKISADRDAWWAQAHAAPDTYRDRLPEYDQFISEDGQLSGMQEGVYGMPDPLQRVAETTGGEDAPIDLLDQPPFLPVSDPRSRYGVGGNVQEFMYNGERWYLTKQGEYAKQYKRSELVTPWQSLPADFF